MADIERILAEEGSSRERLIPILLRLQKENNYLPEQALRGLSAALKVRLSEIVSVASFYNQFRLKPAGRHRIKVCVGTACHVKGADTLFHAIRKYLRIEGENDTDRDRLFTVEKVACLGCCMLAPVIQIDSSIYGLLSAQKIKSVLHEFLAERDNKKPAGPRPLAGKHAPEGIIRVCLCSSCQAAGALDVYNTLMDEIRLSSLSVSVQVVGCRGISYKAPFLEVVPVNGHSCFYGNLVKEDIRHVLATHFRPGSFSGKLIQGFSGIVENRLLGFAPWDERKHSFNPENGPEAQFLKNQKHIAMDKLGEIDPLDLKGYTAQGGFQALEKVMDRQKPEEVIRAITESGLRGRGGAGFPTGTKWHSVFEAEGPVKFLVCNGDEGDPGAFMDRMILESFPFRVLEGILIACHTLGISHAYLYIRGEYELAVTKVREAIRILEENDLCGDHIRGTGFSCKVEVEEGAGAFVCGEETALIASIQGQRGMPEKKPPYPAEKGLWGKPTLVNNVETFAVIPWIIRNGAGSFASMGTAKSKGTKTFALAGKIVRGGLIEVAMGTTLRAIINEIGGGVPNGKKLKAVQIGGPSGGCLPERLLDLPVDFDHLEGSGTIMGSGGMIVLDETDCMVDMARYFLSFTQQESCGKCTYCRVGTRRMHEILENFCQGKARMEDISRLTDLASITLERSLCGLGKTAANPVMTTLRYFREEYEAHTLGICPAKKCRDLIHYQIDDACIGCTRCSQYCPVNAIPFTPYKKHVIDRSKCIRCDTCRRVCPSDAVRVIGGGGTAGA
jgi:NADH-quinone oxidoreductase subunit F